MAQLLTQLPSERDNGGIVFFHRMPLQLLYSLKFGMLYLLKDLGGP